MRILVDIGHPAHVHLFKKIIAFFKSQGHFVYVTARDKDQVIPLLKFYGISHDVLSSPSKKLPGMFLELLNRDWKIIKLNRKYKFDLAIGTSVSIAHLSLLCDVPSFNFQEDDDDYIPLYVYLTYPFSTKIINPDILRFSKWTSKRVLYPSIQELAYLHPNHFKIDLGVLKKYDLEPQKYVIVRLSALSAHHDLKASGISADLERKIEEISSEYKVVYSREVNPTQLVKPWDMHHVLASSKMLISDSQTMTVEAAVLGVPSVRYSTFVGQSSVIEELEKKYELTFGFKPGDEAAFVGKIAELIKQDNLKSEWEKKREKLLMEKVDFFHWMQEYFRSEFDI